jgi:hypothetical protein
MGITPGRSIREKKPTLKTVGHMLMFLARTRKLAGEWKEKRKLQEQLAVKVEGMRRMKGVVRRNMPLGTR